MMQNLQINLRFGKDLVTMGATAAAANAGDYWFDCAYELFVAFAKQRNEFLTEDVRIFAHEEMGLPLPPDGRAWGAIVLRACRAKLIKRVRYAPQKSANCHAGLVSVWQYQGESS
jgi:hypothetical protein